MTASASKETNVARSLVLGLLLLRVALVGMLAPLLFTATDAAARVAITAAAEGDPLGRPPGESERVLLVGTDVQANEIITTSADARAHLVFLDGTTLTVGPSAQLTIEKFVYDPSSKKGELAINASKGVFRLIGGRISKTTPITVTTPSSTMGIRGGIMIFGVEATQTTSIFVFGTSMTVTAGGATQTVTQPGMQVNTSAGSTPSPPTIVVQGSLSAALGNLTGNTKAAAAIVAAINSIVASNLSNAAVLTSIAALIQQIIIQNAPASLTTGTTALNVIIPVVENPNQTRSSPN